MTCSCYETVRDPACPDHGDDTTPAPTCERYTVTLTTGPRPIWDVEELLTKIAALAAYRSTGSCAIRATVFEETA